MEWIVIAIVAYGVYILGEHLLTTPSRLRRQERQRAVQDALEGYDVHAERRALREMLRNVLPSEYQCGRKFCNGILLKHDDYFVCDRCGTLRQLVRLNRKKA